MEKRDTPDYDRMGTEELIQTYVDKAEELNSRIDSNPLPGARRVDETNIPRGKDNLVMAIQQIDLRLFFGKRADERDESKGPILVHGEYEGAN